MEVKMKHVNNLTSNSKDLDVIVKGKITGMSISTEDKVIYKIETDEFDKFEADECCVYHDVTKPVVVKQFVADWYEENKHDLEYNLWDYIIDWYEIEDDEFKNWFNNSKESFQTIINMHQFGYTIDKEKRYLVKMKGVTDQTRTLKHNIDIETWYFGNHNNYEDINAHHTRKELEEAGFGWVFSCEGVEVEEVEG